MDGEANLPLPPPTNLVRPISNPDSSSSTSSSSSPPHFLRHVQAAFKRHRGTTQITGIRPRRVVVPQAEASRISCLNVVPHVDAHNSRDCAPLSHGHMMKDSILQPNNAATGVAAGCQEVASVTQPSFAGNITRCFDENLNLLDVRRVQPKALTDFKENNPIPLSRVEAQHCNQRRVQFSTGHKAISQEMEWEASSQIEASTVVNGDSKNQHCRSMAPEISLKADSGIASPLAKGTSVVQDQVHHFRNFLGQPVTQSSVLGSSCATTTSIHSTSALLMTPYGSQTHQEGSSNMPIEPVGNLNLIGQPVNQGQGDMIQHSFPSLKDTSEMLVDRVTVAAQTSTSHVDTHMQGKEFDLSREQQGNVTRETELSNNPSAPSDTSIKGQDFLRDVNNAQSQASLSKNLPSDAKLEPSKAEKQEKVPSSKATSVPRKRNYDPDLFFKVNGKLYQRLGKIGSGGSSEVHKVISSDCTIYALKKIKLKGRDYATAFGFCQEIEYLNKLKGKNNIIQLIDYEVTDKNLLREVVSGSLTNKDGRVKDDGYIYMVLEYGEIDLAHMLSQKRKEMDSSNQTIDENWLRFYWQQILEAVNTIHEERIVHSDLKPANFLLVKGSLKLIDFGIAKAIMSDTTNIQRDAQVGTLSYMSPEAFMCNESDANGNTIKCGRPSDIWSLGCILYQMVYGRTPFAEYKTFWSKFKVITDPNHEITYGSVSNPWLLDLMKKCLAWDRNKRWRIPQLLQHPFLVPPASSTQDQSCQLLQLVTQSCANDQEASMLCSQLNQLLRDPESRITSQSLTSREQQCELLYQMSNLCYKLQERLAKSV
ncbi:hypothetical protein SLEP1_g2047 [Rubroshorea leprosula]|uniref:Protein kinase domain-containing protein n=1 Tax=Rubroshorea leprosula TaxID=152421 RepID=A0AAV5HME9_9ROSI|nr:hypothetical protein SLEP1_g2047 [Rubroshorea leprosula]